MNSDKILINKFLLALLIIALVALFIFYDENKDAAEQIKNLETNIITLEGQNLELTKELQETQTKLNQCEMNYKELEVETSALLTQYLAQEAFWDLLGRKKLRLICGIAKIQLRDEIPMINDLPC